MTEDRTPAGELLTTLEDHAKGSDASEPLVVVESWEDMGLLPPELFAQLTPEEQDDYLALIEAEHGHVWTLADSPKQLLAQELAPKIDYLYYGGAAGGGKTELAMYHTHELSLRFPGHTTLMLRTTLPELRRSIIRRFSIRLIELGLQQAVRLRKIDNMTAFYYPNGSVIEFGYCVEASTLIRMGDGSVKPISSIRAGELVETLEGPRRVLHCWQVGQKPAVEITLPDGSSVTCSKNHAVLAASGLWLQPGDLGSSAASADRSSRGTTGSRRAKRRFARQLIEASRLRDLPPHAPLSPGRRSGPDEWTGEVAVMDGTHQSGGPGDALAASGLPVAPAGCPSAARDGGLLHRAREVVRSRIRRRADAGTRSRSSERSGGRVRTPGRTPWGSAWYSHPYTKGQRPVLRDVHASTARIVRVGDRDLWDMTVEGAHHYVSRNGIVHLNCSNDEQVGQYLSAEYDLLVMDEASLFSPYAIQMITSRVRTTRRKRKMGIYPHVMYLSNPGGPAHLYLRKFAFDSTNRGESIAIFDVRNGISSEDVLQGKAKPVRLEPMPATPLEARQLELDLSDDEVTVAFIPAKVADNPHIDLGYRNRLAALPEVRRRQMLDGDMMVAEGAAFPEWDPEIHTCEPFEIPPTWDRAAGIDYGWAKPAAIMWGAWDENGTCYLYREDKVLQHAPTEQAKRWLAMEVENGVKMPPRLRMADPSTHASTQGQGVAVPVASQWRHQGFQTRKAPNPRIPGWSNVHSYLAPRSIEHPDGTTEMKPRLVVFTTCTYAIEQLSTIPADKHEPDDVDTNVDDHGADAIRYLLSAVPIREIKRNAPARPEVSGARGRVERYVDRQKRSRRTR